MKPFIEGVERTQAVLFPLQLDEYVTEDNAMRVVDAFIDRLDPKRTPLPLVGISRRHTAEPECNRNERLPLPLPS